jgi:hypothetical protein
MTRDVFEAHLSRLLALPFPPPHTEAHWESLRNVREDVFSAAVSEAAALYDAFPTPRQLLACVAAAERRRAELGPAPDQSAPLDEPVYFEVPNYGKLKITREWKYFCEDCSDSGWRTYNCGAVTRPKPDTIGVACERTIDHAPHEWVGRCACAESNPEVIRKRERMAAMAAQRVSAKGHVA